MKKLLAFILLVTLMLSACKQEIVPNQTIISTMQQTGPYVEETETSRTPSIEPTVPTETKSSSPKATDETEPDNLEQVLEPSIPVTFSETVATEPTEPIQPSLATEEDSTTESDPVQPTVLPPTTETVESTQLPPTEPPQETVSALEAINTAELEAYGREYASGYGYWGNPDTGFATGAGYYPPSRVTIRTMEDGYERIRELVDTQYAIDVATGRPITAIVDGVEVHRKINIYIQNIDDPNVFLLYCFYGGD